MVRETNMYFAEAQAATPAGAVWRQRPWLTPPLLSIRVRSQNSIVVAADNCRLRSLLVALRLFEMRKC